MERITGPGHSTLVISALSRPLDLGTLYDACCDKLNPGITLWKMEDIEKNTYISPQPGMRYHVSTSESLREKTSLLDLDTSMKLSFCAGLIEAEGSAQYLRQKTSSTRNCRVTLTFHQTTVSKELFVSALGAPDPDVLSNTDATHVVTQVLYGADAIMEFHQTARDESSKQEIQGNLKTMIKRIPSVQISGESILKMHDEDKEKVKDLNCRFYGDFQMAELPSTYEEAVMVYKQLPSLLGQDGEKAVPVKVWLYPLSKFTDNKSKLKRMVSDTLVLAVEKAIDDLHLAEIRTNDLLKRSKEIKAEDIITKLETFQSSLRVFTAEFLMKMTDLTPAIRGGTMEESAFKELLISQDAFGFSGKEMEQWLGGKETEINIVTMFSKKLKYDIKPPGPELDSFLMNPDVTDAFVFSFTSLRYEEPYLNKISQTAKTFKSGSTISTEENPTEEDPWYKRPEVKEALDSAFCIINNKIPNKNKVISFIPDSEQQGASVRWYHSAQLKDPHITSNPLPPLDDVCVCL